MNDSNIDARSKDDAATAARTLRLAGVAFILGAVVTGVFNALHPLPGETPEATLAGILDAGVAFWKLDHLMMMTGFWLFAWGFAGVQRSIATGPGAVATRLGFHGVLMTTAAWTLHAALDGFARADVAAAWDSASGARRDVLFEIAVLMQQITDGTFPMVTVFYWGSLATIGIGMAASGAYPRWLGVSLALVSAGLVALGLVAVFAGFSATWDASFATLATLTTLWALVTGVTMTRRARGARRALPGVGTG